ncbi:bifunctional serine/threonine-protein kinase/formylglycine-generating enzyme family protein [Simiduia aestuariiviva]|uniref:Formylglycine-generating enzyme required for sulfatase activity/serine/threonine protein kinase n=1 Tax=Simiduia aestuariiviva TaxID=1510459 RepID=A0A839UQB5_9GAMM|nr:bifunctional serine/threonine-protein kinase/formylglycine-generating enzyme family protein [Simiduia aestuariiviva]MBB3168026.1 formylglycine-generating enzyme required for sulfatase activity/serine/threonine protein kinase [Simiduia aestuariiviva]
MALSQLKNSLGLDETATPQEIAAAIASKKAQLQQKLAAAPTDALKTKFQTMLAQLQAAEAEVAAASAQLQPPSHSPLSQTKLADLPGMGEAAAPTVQLSEGQLLASRYEVKEQIGAGGMGAVYCAFDRTRNKNIAIKVLLPALTSSERARERFLDEARLSSELSHPNIINVFDVQNDGDNWFITMELLEGQSLRSYIASHEATRTPIEVEETLDIVSTLCDALAHAHGKTVHRDIKPENIFLCEDGTVKLMDFGIARLMSNSQRTQTGAAMGTAYYMAPEQIKGRGDIDGRADQYALGVLLYEMLAGDVPTGRIESLHKIRKDVPASLARTVDTALAPKAENRFANITEFKAALTKKGGVALPSLPWKKLGIAAGVLVAAIGVGGLLSSVSVDWASLLPKSKAEIAAQKAVVAKAQGEIKVYKQRLENGRRQLASDLRDAQRNNEKNLAALQHWQDITERAIFGGNQVTELEGQLSMAETLLRENAFEAAQASMDKVSAGYEKLWEDFSAAEELFEAAQKTAAMNEQWQNHSADYEVFAPRQTSAATAAEQSAKTAERSGEFSQAKSHYHSAQQHWQRAFESVAAEVAGVKQMRKYAAEKLAAEKSARRRAEEKKRKERRQAEVEEYQRRAVAAYVGQWVTIPAGSFRMGDLTGNGSSNEMPVRTVNIRAFKMLAHEVTWAQYQPCIDAGACPDNKSKGGDYGWGKGSRPVILVSWNDITQHYIPWLNKASGQRFRLPTEAEWEYAARAGSSTDYPWGNTLSRTYANYGDDECCDGYASGKDQWLNTAPVKSFAPNAWGLYDMHGNVFEYVQDCWNDNYQGAPTNGSAWLSGDCRERVIRGGDWGFPVDFLRSSSRYGMDRSFVSTNRGFRLVQDL